ncbi:cupin domain-containing protein [Allonocardiopsis opalescens]|uniref:Quercetin dioxygenase-like cupin family protein n=1 Tax=Allonocardiopsis opalescens TaxID=1144618 RepID=A0A2T0Q2E0_9ACTN|nr:cupin domain-containing protein [Allonocardiopsis opalescens]PRX97961.1 quercetin dioxygenase-like cupin family protein [Allonocardiopsis opalescens]
MRNTVRSALIALTCAFALALAPASAQATPPSGVTGTTLGRTTVDGRDYVLREITIAPGGSTGWHHHDGPVYGRVRSGTLTHFVADCSTDGVYGPGSTITEVPDEVHVGRNLGGDPLVLEVLYVLPAGGPLSQDDPDPGCGFG